MTYEQTVTRLNAFEYLKEDWNSYGARPIPPGAISKSKSLLNEYFKGNPPKVFPTGRQTVQFEWEEDGAYFEVEIGENEIGFFLEMSGYKTIEKEDATFEDVDKAYGNYLEYLMEVDAIRDSYHEDNFWRSVL